MNPFTVRARFSFSLAFGAVSLSLAILACAIGFASDDLPGAEARAQIGDDGENEGPRSNWFYAQRAYPLETIPHAARARLRTMGTRRDSVEAAPHLRAPRLPGH